MQLQLFPYNYAYATRRRQPRAAPSWTGVREYEVPTDYWRTSVRELAPGVPVGGWVTCSRVRRRGQGFLRSSREGRFNCATDVIGPLAPYDDLRVGHLGGLADQFLAVIERRRAGSGPTAPSWPT